MAALAEFDVLGDHRHRAVSVDAQERAEGAEVARIRAQRHNVGLGATDQQRAAGRHRGDDHHFTASGFERSDWSVHGWLPYAATLAGPRAAATLMAARMRW